MVLEPFSPVEPAERSVVEIVHDREGKEQVTPVKRRNVTDLGQAPAAVVERCGQLREEWVKNGPR
jgi:hypothetical protein